MVTSDERDAMADAFEKIRNKAKNAQDELGDLKGKQKQAPLVYSNALDVAMNDREEEIH